MIQLYTYITLKFNLYIYIYIYINDQINYYNLNELMKLIKININELIIQSYHSYQQIILVIILFFLSIFQINIFFDFK